MNSNLLSSSSETNSVKAILIKENNRVLTDNPIKITLLVSKKIFNIPTNIREIPKDKANFDFIKYHFLCQYIIVLFYKKIKHNLIYNYII